MAQPLRVNGHAFRPTDVEPNDDASGTNYIIIKGRGRNMSVAQKQQLSAHDVFITDYLGQNTYLARYEPASLEPLRNLEFVEQVTVFPRQLKASAPLQDALSSTDSGSATPGAITVDVVLHKGADAIDQVVNELIEKTGLDRSAISQDHDIIRLQAHADTVAKIQEIDSVKKIEKFVEKKLFNNVARVDIGVEVGDIGVTYEGKGETVAIADTGFDKGSTTDTHPAFTGRVKKLIAIGRPGQTDDPNGHGTHCAGSVLGDGDSANMGGRIRGTAPQADLVFQSLLTQRGGLATPANLWNLFVAPYTTHGARVSSNSWGLVWDARQVEYDSEATAVDGFVWHNQDHVIVFAAGNDGLESSPTNAHIGSSSSAKNIICVGATYSSRPASNFAFDPSRTASDSSKIAEFSSRGPTLEGRVKPDVVAPGVAILSASSRDDDITAQDRAAYGATQDELWSFMSGTSMATPLVSGCCASIREALRAGGVSRPSAALVKALVVNGAVDLGHPKAQQGFGLINLKRSLQSVVNRDQDGFGIVDEGFVSGRALAQEETWTRQVPLDIPPSGVFKVTLAFSDRKGQELQNSLSLKVEVKDNSGETVATKVGNDGSEEENNVEQVTFTNLDSAASAVISVTAERIARLGDRQGFALAWAIF